MCSTCKYVIDLSFPTPPFREFQQIGRILNDLGAKLQFILSTIRKRRFTCTRLRVENFAWSSRIPLCIITLDIGSHLQVHGAEVPFKRPESYLKLEATIGWQRLLQALMHQKWMTSSRKRTFFQINL